ncbi:MAG: hypothetical protein ACOX87_11680 [Chloroflexota bacterium]|jgi:hypothetical protein
MTAHEQIAQKAGLPTQGQLRGVITVVQEDRFRLEDEDGQGYLFTLSWGANASPDDLTVWSEQRAPVTVEYQGVPDLGAVATSVLRCSDASTQ